MFEGLLQGSDQKSPIDVLVKMLDPEDVIMKTDVNMTQIKICCHLKYLAELEKDENKFKTGLEIFLDEVIPYFFMLMVSLKRKSREESIKGISEMKEKFMDQQLILSGVPKR